MVLGELAWTVGREELVLDAQRETIAVVEVEHHEVAKPVLGYRVSFDSPCEGDLSNDSGVLELEALWTSSAERIKQSTLPLRLDRDP